MKKYTIYLIGAWTLIIASLVKLFTSGEILHSFLAGGIILSFLSLAEKDGRNTS